MSQSGTQANTAELIAQMKDKLAKVEQLRKQSSQRMANLGEMGEQIKAIEASATSADRSVTVTAGPGGSVTKVTVTDDALRSSATQLSQTITSTIQQAVAEAARAQAAIVEEHASDQAGLLDRVLKTQADQFGMSVDELKEQTGTRTSASTEEPVDYSQESYLRERTEPPAPPQAQDDSGSAGDDFLKNLFNTEDDR